LTRAAVDEGVLAEGGAVAAVVINAAREAVWVCYFNDGTCAPEEIALLKDLQDFPPPARTAQRLAGRCHVG
jgi:hypothetical protein